MIKEKNQKRKQIGIVKLASNYQYFKLKTFQFKKISI